MDPVARSYRTSLHMVAWRRHCRLELRAWNRGDQDEKGTGCKDYECYPRYNLHSKEGGFGEKSHAR